MPAPQMNYKKLRRQLDDLGKAPFNNYVDKIKDKMRGEGVKNVCFCPRSGYENCPRRGGGSKNGNILST